MKHIPKSWKIRQDDTVFDIIDDSGAFCTCTTKEQAQLIVVAPKLLEACKKAEVICEQFIEHMNEEGENMTKTFDEDFIFIKQTIAKVEGN